MLSRRTRLLKNGNVATTRDSRSAEQDSDDGPCAVYGRSHVSTWPILHVAMIQSLSNRSHDSPCLSSTVFDYCNVRKSASGRGSEWIGSGMNATHHDRWQHSYCPFKQYRVRDTIILILIILFVSCGRGERILRYRCDATLALV